MNIIFQIDEPYVGEVDPRPIKKALRSTLQRYSKLNAPTITIVITNNETSRQLNRQYRGVDSATDVLSFENIPDPDFPDFDPAYLGDIVIAYPVAETQALTAGHQLLEELTLLAVHGTLHLLGFDDDTPANKSKMWATQGQIMEEAGLRHVQPTQD